jgi:hypothetical protein
MSDPGAVLVVSLALAWLIITTWRVIVVAVLTAALTLMFIGLLTLPGNSHALRPEPQSQGTVGCSSVRHLQLDADIEWRQLRLRAR